MDRVGKQRRIRMVFGLSNINTDFFQLILCMFVSHYLIGNPLYGAALSLFAGIWIFWFEGNLRNIGFGGSRSWKVFMWILLAVSVIAGAALMFVYPILMNIRDVDYVSLFVLLLAVRSVVCFGVGRRYRGPKTSVRVIRAVFVAVFTLPGIVFAALLMEGVPMWITAGGFVLTGFFETYRSFTLAEFSRYADRRRMDKTAGIFSYNIFSHMTLYSQTAFSLGILMFICYMTVGGRMISSYSYLEMGAWLLLVYVSFELFTWVANRRGQVLNINFFIVGAVLWIVGSVRIYGASGSLWLMLWTLCWGFGLSAVSAVTNRFNADLKMVAELSGRRIGARDLYSRNLLTQIVAVMFSNVIALCVISLWVFLVPTFEDVRLPGLIRQLMIQLPLVFMLVSLGFALRQPLDERISQKLSNYLAGVNRNRQTRRSLRNSLFDRNRVKFGVKIIAFFVKPFLRLRVSGRENMDFREFPSIFVCNHGIIYGPVAAVIYLPTYFRPWIDKKMCDRALCGEEMYRRFMRRIPVLPARVKKWMAHLLSGPVTWAMNSFDPIKVDKGGIKGVSATMDDTVKVLKEGDNVLIFPERPRRVTKRGEDAVLHETDTVGRLSTGFAGIGGLCYDETGKPLRFYPIYANRRLRTFRIGEPVVFDPSNDRRDERQRISSELHERMLELVGGK